MTRGFTERYSEVSVRACVRACVCARACLFPLTLMECNW